MTRSWGYEFDSPLITVGKQTRAHWPRRGAIIGPSESTHQDLSSFSGHKAWVLQKGSSRVSNFSTQQFFTEKLKNKNGHNSVPWAARGLIICVHVALVVPHRFLGAPGARKTQKIIKIRIFPKIFPEIFPIIFHIFLYNSELQNRITHMTI